MASGGSIALVYSAAQAPASVTITGRNGTPVNFTVNGSAVTFPYAMTSTTKFDTTQSGSYTLSVVASGLEIAGDPDGTHDFDLHHGQGEVIKPSLDPGRLPDLSVTFAQNGKAKGGGLKELARRAGVISTGTATRVPWVVSIDSLASALYTEFRDELALQLGGYAGYFGFGNSNPSTTGTVTANTTDYTKWPTGETWTLASAGASVAWTVSGGSPVCDTMYVFYIKDGAGTFKVQVDGSDEAGYTNVSTAGSGDLGVITITKARAAHQVKVVQLTGSPTFIPAGYVDSTVSGLVPVNLGKAGLELADFMGNAQCVANLTTFLTTVAPAVISYQAREVDLVGLRARLDSLFALYRATGADLVAIGAPWDGRSGTIGGLTYAEWTRQQNDTTKAAAEAAGGVYWDANQVVPNWATINAMGAGADPIHPSPVYNKFVAALFRRDLGFDALAGLVGRIKLAAQSLVATTDITIAGKDRAAPEGIFKADTSVGSDVSYWGKRWLRFYDSTGTTEWMRLVLDNATEGWLPPRIKIGSGMAGLLGAAAGIIDVRNGTTFTNYASMRMRSLLLQQQSPTFAANKTIDFASGGFVTYTLTGNTTGFSLTGAVGNGEEFEVHFIQDATGSRTLAGTSGIQWAGSTAPTLTTTPGRRDIFRFRYIGSSTYAEVSRSMNVG